jgi:hypothetical protein
MMNPEEQSEEQSEKQSGERGESLSALFLALLFLKPFLDNQSFYRFSRISKDQTQVSGPYAVIKI